MTIPYSSPQLPFLGQLKDVILNDVQASDTLEYDSTTGTWNNVANGNITLTGTNDAVLFKKSDTTISAPNNTITLDATASGYTINLDGNNKYVGINKTNPTSNLDVSGVCLINTIEISNNYIGNIDAGTNIRIYSHNLPDKPFIINSTKDLADIGGFRTKEPDTVDTIYPSDKDCFYKVQLSLGMDKWSGGVFDTQEDYGSFVGFPSSQVVEYQNRAPITGARIIGKPPLEGELPVDTTRVLSYFGTQDATPSDLLYYDPVQMRSRKSGNEWIYAGAPSLWRNADKKLIFTIKFFVSGTYPARRVNNQIKVYANQYRSGALLRTNEIYSSPSSETEHSISGERTFLSHTSGLNEDFNPATDDWIVELFNTAGGDSFTTTMSNAEIICYEAQ